MQTKILSLNSKRIKYLKYLSLIGFILAVGSLVILLFDVCGTTKELSESQNDRQTQYLEEEKDLQLKLVKPKFTGMSQNQLPYEVISNLATKNSGDITYNLTKVDAKYLLAEGTLYIKADKGIFDDVSKQVLLSGFVNLNLNNAIFYATEVNFNLENLVATSSDPVEVLYKKSNIKANSFRSDGKNDIIEFKGNVRTRLSTDDF